jgi:hypothetical protein
MKIMSYNYSIRTSFYPLLFYVIINKMFEVDTQVKLLQLTDNLEVLTFPKLPPTTCILETNVHFIQVAKELTHLL